MEKRLSCDCARTFRSQCWQASIITAQLVGKIHIFVNRLTPTQTLATHLS